MHHRPSILRSATLACLTAVAACAPTTSSTLGPSPVRHLREVGQSGDGNALGRWLLAEMFDPGGTAAHAKDARARLGQNPRPELLANFARAVYDEAHGEPVLAADGFAATLQAATTSRDRETPLVAWYAARSLAGLRGAVADLFARQRHLIEGVLREPGPNLGWRAVAELEEWRSAEVYDKAERSGETYDKEVVGRLGCAPKVALAGPFGRGGAADHRRPFAPERPGPWPHAWPNEAVRGTVPHVLSVAQNRCLASSAEHLDSGVYYAQVFFTTPSERELVVAAQGAVKVWVDDAPVLERDLREWGVWQRFGAAVRVGAGRHRVLARLLSDTTSVRLLNVDGSASGVAVDTDGAAPYALVPPVVGASPNLLDAFVKAEGAPTYLEAALGAAAAHAEGMDDVAAVLLEPLVAPKDAAPQALELAASVARGDVAFPEDVRRRNERDLRRRAVAADGHLLYSRSWLVLDDGDQRGWIEAVEPLRALAKEFPHTPEVLEQTATVLGRLGWRAERMATLADLAKRFPDDVNALRLYLEALDEDGEAKVADPVAARIQKLDPDAEVALERALARHDWKGAIAELRRIEQRRPDRKEMAARVADVLERAGDAREALAQLGRAVAKNPEDSTARFRLADRAYAHGDGRALHRALADALAFGGKTDELREAIDLIEGATNLEPYRQNGRAVIREFDAWEKAGHHMDGTAARILDYAATWVKPDGSSEMLEHEILKIQSQEAATKEAEQPPPTGLILRLRVLKPDGHVLEPEFVSGKPTLTMPHLDVGDCIEIEHITPFASDGEKGRRFRGPHWFFREADKGYWRSELVTVTPKDRPLEVEVRGTVPPPVVKDLGILVERRWRMDLSPPAPDEPDAPRPQEFLPSVRIGWGVTLEDMLSRAVDAVSYETPLDPRLRAKAKEIVQGETRKDEQAQKLYRWVLESVEEGRETDGRRAVLGKSGSREAAFEHLARQLGIPTETAVVKNRLAMPPLGAMSEVENWDAVVLRLTTERGVRWLTVRDKFAPFAYMPAELRGQPAIRLVPGTPRDKTDMQGTADGVAFEGRATLRADGSADVDLSQSYTGKMAISMRNIFDRVPESQLRDFVESRLLGRNLPGARLRDFELRNKTALDQPLVLRVRAEVPQLVKSQGNGWALRSLFPLHMAQLATLPERQTPLLLGGSSHVEVKFDVDVPETMKAPTLQGGEARDGERLVSVKDAMAGRVLELRRLVDVPAGRVQPGPEYARFLRFAQDADALVEREIVFRR